MMAFLTGSRVYGTPHEESDTDIVVRVDEQALSALWAIGDMPCDLNSARDLGWGHSIRIGPLNIIAVTTDKQYAAWLIGTSELLKRAPVTKAQAIDHFDRIFGINQVPSQEPVFQ